jgi:xylan 1,4-beta-xylosidase
MTELTSGWIGALSADPTSVSIDLSGPAAGELPPFWKACVGSGHAHLGLRADWKRQLAAVNRDTGITGVRFHGIFDDDMEVVSAGPSGLQYNWTAVNALWDGVLRAGVTAPIVELSYMPQAIANCTPGLACVGVQKPGQPCRTPWSNHDDKGAGLDHGCRLIHYYNGTTEPPRKWELWYDLVRAFGENVVARYGLDAVATWRFEVYALPDSVAAIMPQVALRN